MKVIFLIFGVVSMSQPFPRAGNYFIHPNQMTYSSIPPRVRIIGGQDAAPHAYPYQVGMYLTKGISQEFCGGSIISSNYVLTAAHCLDKASKATLIFGAHNIKEDEATQVRVTITDVTQFIIHPGWNAASLTNDIALVKLLGAIKESNVIKFVKLASGSDTFAGSKGIVTGWGVTFNSQKGVTPVLKYVTSTILTNEDCKNVNADYKKVVKSTIMCFSGKGTVGTCQGDSGGPVLVDGVQVGIVSFGASDCSAGLPSVFTRLTEYKNWIISNSDVKY
nr:chymotrypsin BII-like [Leptinotarsa decemlineata]